jgi:hypothetical protein
VNTVTVADVQSAIMAHNLNNGTHEDIRSQLRSIASNVTSSTQVIANAIAEHDASHLAHPALRQTVTQMDADMLVVRDISERIAMLEALYTMLGLEEGTGVTPPPGTGDSSIFTSVATLQDMIAVLKQIMNTHETNINDLFSSVTIMDNFIIANASENDAFMLQQNEIYLKVLMHEFNDGKHLDVNTDVFTSTFPYIVQRGTSVTFNMSNLVLPTGASVTYEITSLADIFSFSKTTGIAPLEDVTAQITAGAVPGTYHTINVVAHVTGTVTANIQLIIMTKVNSVPKLDLLNFTMPKTVEPAGEYHVILSGGRDPDGHAITYRIENATGNPFDVEFSKSIDISTGEEFIVTIPANAPRDSLFGFSVTGTDDLGEAVTIVLTGYKVNKLPDISLITHNIPVSLKPGQVYTVQLNYQASSTDIALDNLTLEIVAVENNAPITFSKNTNIAPGENILMMVSDNDVNRGGVFTIRITAKTGGGAQQNLNYEVRVNTKPISSLVTTTVNDMTVLSGQTYPVQITGGSDADASQTLKYSIENLATGLLIFNKTQNISNMEEITMSVLYVLAPTVAHFNVFVVDSVGEQSALPKQVTVTVSPKLKTATPAILYPQHLDTNVPRDFNVEISNYDTVVVS